MVQGSILSPHTPYIIYIIYILLLSILLISTQRYIYSSLYIFSYLHALSCLMWGCIAYSFMPFSFESMYRLVWGDIGISMFFFSLLLFSIWLSLSRYEDNQNIYSFIYPTYLLWFCFVVGMRRYRYIYLPPWTYPLFGARVYHMVQISHRSPIKQNTHFV